MHLFFAFITEFLSSILFIQISKLSQGGRGVKWAVEKYDESNE